jgi:hypothetical protein
MLDEKSNELSKYVPLRFLICMISAITNPFLYSYFNETFKTGLQRIFSSCCLKMNNGINEVSFEPTDYSVSNVKLEKNNLQTRSNCYQPSNLLNGDFNSRSSHDPSTRLTIMSSNRFSSSISSQI